MSWQLVVLLLVAFFLVLFRGALRKLLGSLAGRANKLSLYEFSIELASVQPITAPELNPMLATLQQPDSLYVSTDAFDNLTSALQGRNDLQYVYGQWSGMSVIEMAENFR
jgi:hypothetical protein